MATRVEAKRGDLYDEDFAAWVERQVGALRALAASGAAPPDLDLAHLIEEVEELGGSERRGVENRVVIIGHLLKLEYSPAAEPRRGWHDSAHMQRAQLARDLGATLSNHVRAVWDDLYPAARDLAADGLQQDGVPAAILPESCPYSFEQVTQREWWPRNRHGHDNP